MAKEKAKKQESKLLFEREYTVPLRKGWLKVQEYKRANKAVKTLKEFLVRHMKIYDRDLKKIKLDIILNNELRFRGIRKPPAKIKILAKKYDDGNVKVSLVKVPEKIKFELLRVENKKEKIKKAVSKIEKEKEELKETEKRQQETKDAKEKEQASKDQGLEISKEQAIEQKHIVQEPLQSKIQQNIGGKRSQKGR
jgi:ribosomal protein L31E